MYMYVFSQKKSKDTKETTVILKENLHNGGAAIVDTDGSERKFTVKTSPL